MITLSKMFHPKSGVYTQWYIRLFMGLSYNCLFACLWVFHITVSLCIGLSYNCLFVYGSVILLFVCLWVCHITVCLFMGLSYNWCDDFNQVNL